MEPTTLRNPYSILDISSTASLDEIKSAYRRAVRTCHPDTHPGNPDAAEKFREIVAAYDLLSTPARRSAFDLKARLRRERQQKAANSRSKRSSSGTNTPNSSIPEAEEGAKKRSTFEDVFDAVFGSLRAHSETESTNTAKPADTSDNKNSDGQNTQNSEQHKRRRSHTQQKSSQSKSILRLTFAEAALGCEKPLGLPSGRVLNIQVPPGVEDGDTVPSPLNSLNIFVRVEPHKFLRRDGHDLHLDLPISLDEALLGARVTIPWLEGKIVVKIPSGAQPDQSLRLRGKGVVIRETPRKAQDASGDLFIRLKVILPTQVDREFEAAIDDWAHRNPHTVRKPHID